MDPTTSTDDTKSPFTTFTKSTHYAYIYVPYKNEDLYVIGESRNNFVTLLEKMTLYDNPSISINHLVRAYFYRDDLPIMPTMTHYIKWLNTLYVVDKGVFVPPI